MGSMVSLCFDDGLDAHIDIAMPELERRGWRGTFFVPVVPFDFTYDPPKPFAAGGQTRVPAWCCAANQGHEIATHCIRHCSEREMAQWGEDIATAQAAQAKAVTEFRTGHAVTSHAYPKGYFTPTIKAAVAACYEQARSVAYCEGVARGAAVDWFNVGTVCLGGGSWRDARLAKILDGTLRQGLWTVLSFHAIGLDDSQCLNMQPGKFLAVLDEIQKRKIEVVTFGEAAQRWRGGR